LKRVIRKANAFGLGTEIRFELTRAVLGRCERWLDQESTEDLDQACTLMRQAAEAGLEQIGPARTKALVKSANRCMEEGRWGQAVARCEEAWGCSKDQTRLPGYLVACLLRWREGLQEDNRIEEAAEALKRAREVAREARGLFESNQEVQMLLTRVEMAGRGHPTSEMLNLPGTEAEEAPPPSAMAEDAIQALKECREALREEDWSAAYEAAERARRADPNHPDTVALAAQLGLEVARNLPVDEGAPLFDEVETYLKPIRMRFGGHRRLQDAAAVLDRDRILYSGDGHLTTLHRKGLRLFLERRYSEAAELLGIVVALASRQDPEVVALLADTLISDAEALVGRNREGARSQLGRAQRLLAIGRETAPEHSGLSRLRDRWDEVNKSA
jgi:tetratricopeptide (TPR) repeat protein